MRRAIVLCIAGSLLLGGCVGWTGASQLKSPDKALYSGYVDASPAVFAGPLPAMAYPYTYTVQSCFHDPGSVKDVFGLILGADPLDRACRQYRGVDLRDYPASASECFPADEASHPIQGSMARFYPYRHPWLGESSSPECAKLIADIKAAKKGK